MLLKESELYDPDIIRPVLGKPYKKPGKLLTATGSTYYFLKSLTYRNGEAVAVNEHSKAIFQWYDKGLMLLINRSNYQKGVMLPEESIQRIQLIEGRRIIPINSIASLALKLGFRRDKVMKLGVFGGIGITETKLYITTDQYEAYLICNGYSFETQKKYFEGLGYGSLVEITENS